MNEPRRQHLSVRSAAIAPRPSQAGVMLALSIALAAWATPARAIDTPQVQLENKRCFECHAKPTIVDQTEKERRAMLELPLDEELPPARHRPNLYVTADHLAPSVHANVTCVSCHADTEKLPHRPVLAKATCGNCHEKAGAAFHISSHAPQADKKLTRDLPTCATCHGGHEIAPVKDLKSPVFPLNAVKLCGDCHEQHVNPADTSATPTPLVQSYLESVHGKMVTKAGLIVAATCVDCHKAHDVFPSTDPRSSMHHEQVPQTCGACHLGIQQVYDQSIHGRKLREGDAKAPVCVDCHTAHAVTRVDTDAFVVDIVTRCGNCHDKPLSPGGMTLYATYRRSYHGQATALGSTRSARCDDCHGAHDVLARTDAQSPMAGEARRAACEKCHQGATASFAMFEPHADHTDGKRYPLLHAVWIYFILVISGTFCFFGLHTIAWFGRSMIQRVKTGPQPRHKVEKTGVRRFTKLDRINHALMAIAFFGLTLTGMPLLFSDTVWATRLAAMFGGVRVAGALHRIFAIMLIINFAVHLVGVVSRVRKMKLKAILFGPTTLLPRWRDVKDMFAMFRWFARGKRMPTFDRWTYWEKFDYWAEIFGTTVIGVTGLVLWFPNFASKLLPGWVFNVAALVHGYEALLAVGFIFTIHFFNANLRPGKFPVDPVMITGYVSEEEFKEERGDEYQRVAASGELESLRVPVMDRAKQRLLMAVGITAMLIGLVMVTLIVLAGLGVL